MHTLLLQSRLMFSSLADSMIAYNSALNTVVILPSGIDLSTPRACISISAPEASVLSRSDPSVKHAVHSTLSPRTSPSDHCDLVGILVLYPKSNSSRGRW